MKNQRRFKNFIINPAYQLKYVFWLTGTGLLLTLVNSAIFYSFTKENYAILVDLSPMTEDARSQLYAELHRIFLYLAVFSAAFLIFIAALGIYLSHRTAGPLYQFKRVFDDVRAGNRTSRLSLRPNDEFRDVADAFNQMMDSLGPSK